MKGLTLVVCLLVLVVGPVAGQEQFVLFAMNSCDAAGCFKPIDLNVVYNNVTVFSFERMLTFKTKGSVMFTQEGSVFNRLRSTESNPLVLELRTPPFGGWGPCWSLGGVSFLFPDRADCVYGNVQYSSSNKNIV